MMNNNVQMIFENIMRRNAARRAGLEIPSGALTICLQNGDMIWTVDVEMMEDIIGAVMHDQAGTILKPGRYITALNELLIIGIGGKVSGMTYDPAAAMIL